MKYLFAFLVLILFYNPVKAESVNSASYDHIVSSNVLRCGYFTWPPFLSRNPTTAKLEGISNDIMEGIGQILDLKIEWTTEVGIADFTNELQTNKFDAVCISNWPQPLRFKEALATVPLYYTSAYPVVRKDDIRLDISYNPIKKGDLKLGVIEGDAPEKMVQKLFPDAPREVLPNNASYSELLAALTAKKLDVVFLDKSVIQDFIKNNPDQIKIPSVGRPVFNYPEYLFVKRGDIETKFMLDNAIQILRESGDMQKLLNKYQTSTTVYPLETAFGP